MAGVTDPPFRALCRRFGPALYVSEMVTARAVVERNEKTFRMCERDPGSPPGAPHSVQLYGVDPRTMGEATRILVDELGVSHVDLNLGCPVPKVTRKGGGAALPVHGALLRRIVAATVTAAGSVPVTVKCRIGVDEQLTTFLDTGRIAEDEGCAAIALHARTAEQQYSGRADWDRISELKAAVRIPVLGNGDVWDGPDALVMMAATGCDGVVVGRGCLGRPWLFGDLAAAFAGAPAVAPRSLGEAAAVLVDHAEALVAWYGEEPGMHKIRKHVGWYLMGYPVGAEARRALVAAVRLQELREGLACLDPDVELPGGMAPRPRGQSHGPRRVVLPAGWLETRDDPTPPVGAELEVSGG